ncbi:MAG: hypothetical protein PHP05_04205 [Sideroxydans sp.]|nr:hypothetical protein [Sideroxydans sp.]
MNDAFCPGNHKPLDYIDQNRPCGLLPDAAVIVTLTGQVNQFSRKDQMPSFFPLLVNILVIGVITAELIATVLGAINANQLLVVSAISGGLTIFSLKLSQQALNRLNHANRSEDEQLQEEIRSSLSDRRPEPEQNVSASNRQLDRQSERTDAR